MGAASRLFPCRCSSHAKCPRLPMGWRASLVDAAGDGLAQAAGEGGPCWRYLTWIALTRVLKRVGRVLARVIVLFGFRPSGFGFHSALGVRRSDLRPCLPRKHRATPMSSPPRNRLTPPPPPRRTQTGIRVPQAGYMRLTCGIYAGRMRVTLVFRSYSARVSLVFSSCS